MKRKRILLILAIIILLIFIIIDVSLILKKSNENNKKKISNNVNVISNVNENYIIFNDENQSSREKVEQVKDNETFYTVENCIKKFESFVNLNYNKQINEIGQPSLAAEYNIHNKKEKQEAILKLLDKDYINKNNINESNVFNYVVATTDEGTVEAIKINKLVSNNTNVNVYSAYAKKINNEKSQYIYYVVKLDIGDVFSIYPISANLYKSIDEINITNNTEYIEENNRNKFLKPSINNGQIATKYFQEYKSLLLKNPNAAYEKLDKEYKNKRFGSVNEFTNYIKDNKENIELMQIYRYDFKKYDNYAEYIAKDRYDNVYTFDEIAPKDYTVKLDNYTIETEKYKSSYNSTSDEGKVNTNVNKFISMINNKDYKHAYGVLNSTFKNKNYNTFNKFTTSIKNKMFDINKINSIKQSKSGDYYTCNVELSDYKGESSNKINMQIIIKLKQGTDFELSFSF